MAFTFLRLLTLLFLIYTFTSCTSKLNNLKNLKLLEARQLMKKAVEQKNNENDSLAFEIGLKVDSLLQLADPKPTEEKGDCHYLLGIVSYNLGLDQYITSQKFFLSADSIYQAIENIGKAADARVYAANALWYREGVAAAIPLLEEAIIMAESDKKVTRRFRGKYYADRALAHVYQYNFRAAKKLLEKAVKLDMNAFGLKHINTLSTLKIQADYFTFLEDFYTAGTILEKILKGYENILPPNHRNVGVIYGSLGNFNFQMGNLIGAKNYYEKTIEIFSKKLPANHPNNIVLYIKLIDLYNNLGDYKKAKEWSELANKYVQKGSELYGSVKMGEGLINYREGSYKQAIDLFKESKPYISKITSDSSIAVANLLESLGGCYTYNQQYQEAREALKKALTIYKNYHGEVHPSCARVYSRLSELALVQDFLNQALVEIDHGIQANGGYVSLESFEGNPDTWLALLSNKAEVLVSIGNENDLSYWQEAFTVLNYLDVYIDSLKSSYNSPKELQYLNRQIQDIYDLAVHVCYLLQDENPSKFISRAFYFGEKSKNYRLLESLQRMRIKELVDFQMQQDKYQMMTHFYTKKLSSAIDSIEYLRYKGYLSDFLDSTRLLRQNLRINNRALFNDLTRINYTTSAQLQASLTDKESLVNYSMTKYGEYGIVITMDTLQFVLLDDSDDIRKKITEFRYILNEGFLKSTDDDKGLIKNANDYAKLSYELYQLLIKPMQPWIKEHLIIVSDEILGYVPFEALLTTIPSSSHKFVNHDYLINNHAISYNFSATLWHQQKLDKKQNNIDSISVVAFAPFCTQEQTAKNNSKILFKSGEKIVFKALKNSRKEIKNIMNLFSGKTYFNQTASIQKFKEECSFHNIIHLSTHGFANDLVENDAFLLFADPDSINRAFSLFLNEVAILRINADLVVISACESGVGSLDEGEGIISLSRAFTHAGAKSLLNSLWSVDDEATSDLMGYYYKYLHDGLKKDEALKKAKIQYIQSVETEDRSHPFFWAGFILNGSNTPIH